MRLIPGAPYWGVGPSARFCAQPWVHTFRDDTWQNWAPMAHRMAQRVNCIPHAPTLLVGRNLCQQTRRAPASPSLPSILQLLTVREERSNPLKASVLNSRLRRQREDAGQEPLMPQKYLEVHPPALREACCVPMGGTPLPPPPCSRCLCVPQTPSVKS